MSLDQSDCNCPGGSGDIRGQKGESKDLTDPNAPAPPDNIADSQRPGVRKKSIITLDWNTIRPGFKVHMFSSTMAKPVNGLIQKITFPPKGQPSVKIKWFSGGTSYFLQSQTRRVMVGHIFFDASPSNFRAFSPN